MIDQTDIDQAAERLRRYANGQDLDAIYGLDIDCYETDRDIVIDAYLAGQQRGESDLTRLLEWIRDPNRKSPALAFTSGTAREIADLWVMQQRGERELTPLLWHSSISGKYWYTETPFGDYYIDTMVSSNPSGFVWYMTRGDEEVVPQTPCSSFEDGVAAVLGHVKSCVAGLYVGGEQA
jgi:hypothetical protein